MTIHLPTRLLLLVAYTTLIAAMSFGISYAVFEWRNDDDASASADREAELSNASDRIGQLDSELKTLRARLTQVEARTDTGDPDHDECHRAILDYVVLGFQVQAGEISGSALETKVNEVSSRYDASC